MRRLLLALPLLAAPAADAQQVACGEPYVIRRGDTLQRIANRAYGADASFAPIWEANRARLRWGDPSRIEVGQTIEIPCPAPPAVQAAAEAAPAANAAPPGAPVVRPEPTPAAETSAQAEAAVAQAPGPAAGSTEEPAPVAPSGGAAPDAAPSADVAAESPPPETAVAEAAAAAAAPGAGALAAAPAPADPSPAAAPSSEAAEVDPPGALTTAGAPNAAAVPETAPDAEPAADASAVVAAASPRLGDTPAPPRVVRLLAIEDPPLVDRARPSGGLATAVVVGAFAAAGRETRLASESESLEPATPFDVSFPWFRPACEAAALSPADRAACDAMLWSAPVGEHLTAFVGLTATPAPASLAGLAICAAPGIPAAALAGAGAVVEGPGLDPCFEAVARGEADLAAVEAGAADAALGAGVFPELGERPRLARATPVHAVAPMGSPHAADDVAALDRGLRILRGEGRLFALVEAALSD